LIVHADEESKTKEDANNVTKTTNCTAQCGLNDGHKRVEESEWKKKPITQRLHYRSVSLHLIRTFH